MFAGLEHATAHPRRWTAMLSFTLQGALAAAALVIPLLKPEGLPEAFVPRRIFVPVLSDSATSAASHASNRSGHGVPAAPLLVTTNRFTFGRTEAATISGLESQPPSVASVVGTGDGVPNSIVNESSRPMPHPASAVRLPRVSVIMEGNLLHRIEPQYPAIAKAAGIQGTVVIKAIISRGGLIEKTQVLSGPPLLVQAAVTAVRQWKYRPYYLNGDPVEVETEITVNFVLNR